MPKPSKPSVTFTALIWLGIVLALVGAAVAILGAGGAITFNAKFGDAELHTTNLGLVILVAGASLAAFVTAKLPKGVTVFAVQKRTMEDRFAASSGWFAAFALFTVLLLILSLVFR